ncbi:MAG TPA: hypothetical protein VNK04_01410 [Gemmataceae bacterium]|nr:hypothetical protein [Gemmataceae bacterium]
MSKPLGPIEICCDAPPYNIVRACSQLGFRTPEDVRWFRMSHFLSESTSWRELLKHQPWKVFLGMYHLEDRTCSCGQSLPRLERYTFMLITGKELSYLLGQCSRCRTIFWEEA